MDTSNASQVLPYNVIDIPLFMVLSELWLHFLSHLPRAFCSIPIGFLAVSQTCPRAFALAVPSACNAFPQYSLCQLILTLQDSDFPWPPEVAWFSPPLTVPSTLSPIS